jgi:hypothetical protein
MGLPPFNKLDLSVCAVWDYEVVGSARVASGLKRVPSLSVAQAHVQETVGHTVQGFWVRITALVKLSIPASACRIVLDRNSRPVLQRQPKSHMGGLVHAHYAVSAAAAAHRGHTAQVAQGSVISSAEGTQGLASQRRQHHAAYSGEETAGWWHHPVARPDQSMTIAGDLFAQLVELASSLLKLTVHQPDTGCQHPDMSYSRLLARIVWALLARSRCIGLQPRWRKHSRL